MKKKILFLALILAVIAGAAGAVLSAAMVVRAVQWSEWGRVALYCVTAAVCVEMALLAAFKLRSKEPS